jgi:5,5'-dehydrodivanillate O-demethylase oxygenase subunit
MADDDALWTIGRCCLWPNMLFTGNHFEWRVPIDDTRTLSVTWAFSRVPHESEPYIQTRIPAWHGAVKDAAGNWISSHVMNQDFIAWAGQGIIADRTLEHLGPSDRGIILQRKRFLDDLEAIQQGRDPKATIRDAALNQCIALPVADRELLTKGLSRERLKQHPIYGRHLADYPFQLGQPEGVRQEFVDAMGI